MHLQIASLSTLSESSDLDLPVPLSLSSQPQQPLRSGADAAEPEFMAFDMRVVCRVFWRGDTAISLYSVDLSGAVPKKSSVTVCHEDA